MLLLLALSRQSVASVDNHASSLTLPPMFGGICAMTRTGTTSSSPASAPTSSQSLVPLALSSSSLTPTTLGATMRGGLQT